MKKLLLLSLFSFPLLVFAQDKVDPITIAIFPPDYYLEQSQLWEKELTKDPFNENAWLNYFKAARYSNLFHSPKIYQMDELMENMKDAIPNSFTYHYCYFWQTSLDQRGFNHLLKAHEIDPSRPEIFDDLVLYYHQAGDDAKAKEFCEKWYASGSCSPGILAWNYNVLMSVEENAILLTQGDNDTEPVWLLQYLFDVRPDIEVLNVFLISGLEFYRKRHFEALDIPDKTAPEWDGKEYEKIISGYIAHIIEHTDRPVYMGTGLSRGFRQPWEEDLYLVGLAFKHSNEPFNNMLFLKENFERKFLLDYLRAPFYNDPSQSILKDMNLGYVPGLMMLKNYYEEAGVLLKAEENLALAKRITRQAGREKMLAQYLGQEDQKMERDWDNPPFKIKDLEKEIKQVNDSLWAFSTEVSIAQYQLFLMDLLKHREYELLKNCMQEGVNWKSNLPENISGLSESELFKNGHPDDKNMPIQNISYKAAQTYLYWLTEWYNHQPEKKRNYPQIQFRLPSKEEWTLAARGGNESAPFPWGGFYSKNSKGCYLGNFNTSEDKTSYADCTSSSLGKDGGYFPVKVDAYFPNDFGLFNMSGNVAEMVREEGVAMGGSWLEIPTECTVTSAKKYTGKSSSVGFRVFMEIQKNEKL